MDTNRPIKVSIAMTTYNGERYILEQLGSILAQNRKPDEVIICDDGSGDQTATLVEDFIKTNGLDTWHLYVNTANMGFVKNFYQAISLTTGDVIFLCDQDDVWYPDKIAKMVKLFEDNEAVKVLNAGFEKIDQDNQPVRVRQRFGRSNNNLIKQSIKPKELRQFGFESIIWRNISPGCTLAFTDEIKSFYLNYHTDSCPHDWELNILGAVLGGLYFYNEALIGYRIHTGNTIGLADLKGSERLATYDKDPRIKSVIEEYDRACAYLASEWAENLHAKQRKALAHFRGLTLHRKEAILKGNLKHWLWLFTHLLDYKKLRGWQGIYNDIKSGKSNWAS